jgi:hypothetical protein
MTMNKNRQNMIALHIWCYVAKYFSRFVNPENRGPNFTWSKFPILAQNYCETNMWVASGLADTTKNEKEELEFIRATSKKIAEELVENAGL